MTGSGERLDRVRARRVERHQRAACLDERAQGGLARLAEPARVLLRHRALRVPVAQRGRGLVGQHDRVEALGEPSGPHVTVRERLIRDAHLLLEDVARPALVHRRHPRAVEPDARSPEREAARVGADAARDDAELGGDRLEPAPRRGRNHERPRREAPAVFLEGVERPSHRDPCREQPRERHELAAARGRAPGAARGLRRAPSGPAHRRAARARLRRAPSTVSTSTPNSSGSVCAVTS